MLITKLIAFIKRRKTRGYAVACLLFVLFAFFVLPSITTKEESIKLRKSDSPITVSLFPLPDTLDPSRVLSASQYIILDHLVRPLIRMTSGGTIQGDLATSWNVSSDHRRFEFQLDPKAKFSDGSSITAADVVRSIQFQRKKQSAVHFDFREISSVSAPAEHQLEIVLKFGNPNLLLQLVHPEFGVYHEGDINKDAWHRSQKTPIFFRSSGPYSILANSSDAVITTKNPHYSGFAENAPASVKFVSIPTSEQLAKIRARELAFAIPFGIKTIDELALEQTDSTAIRLVIPPIGFTYWISLNPESDALRATSNRHHLQYLVNQHLKDRLATATHPWSFANQLYLPDGLGRPSRRKLDQAWNSIKRNATAPEKPTRLRLLLSKHFPFSNFVIKAFESAGYSVHIDHYSNQDEFWEKRTTQDYDAFLINNDFSSLDLLTNLLTTFQPSRPLIPLTKSTMHLLEAAKSLPHGPERNELFSAISIAVLTDGLVIPLAYNRLTFLHSSQLDIGKWSSIFPEISLWKATIRSFSN